jgi:hypothetical protein
MAGTSDNRPNGWVIIVGAPLLAAIVGLLCHIACSWKEKDDQRHRGMAAAASGEQERPPEARELAVEMRAGPLLCAYQSGNERWREAAACPVCLSDLADGETVRVLPPCMHYFHPACVGEWLHSHDTCPVCRAVPAAAAAFPAAMLAV